MKYGKDITLEITQKLEMGNNRTDTCALVRISYDTFCQWMLKPEFSEAIKSAEARCKQRCIGIIQKAALTTWQAAAWWLERKHQDEYAVKYRLGHEGKDGAPILVINDARSKLKGMDKKQLREIATRG